MSKHRIRHQKPDPAAKTRHAFYLLTLDWIHLKTLPKPTGSGQNTRRSTNREYGHPAEWASDKAAEIATILTTWHDLLAEQRGETRPIKGIITGLNNTPTTPAHEARIIPAPRTEQHRVTTAWKYLEPRFEHLLDIVTKEDLKEIDQLHHQIQRALGKRIVPQQLGVPCPGCNRWGVLQRHVRVGRDLILCGACHYDVPEQLYPHFVRVVLTELINNNTPAET